MKAQAPVLLLQPLKLLKCFGEMGFGVLGAGFQSKETTGGEFSVYSASLKLL